MSSQIRRRDRAASVVEAVTVAAAAGTVVATVGLAAAMSPPEASAPQLTSTTSPAQPGSSIRPPATAPTTAPERSGQPGQPTPPVPPQTAGS